MAITAADCEYVFRNYLPDSSIVALAKAWLNHEAQIEALNLAIELERQMVSNTERDGIALVAELRQQVEKLQEELGWKEATIESLQILAGAGHDAIALDEENAALRQQLAEARAENERLRAENDELRQAVEHPPSVEKFIDNLADSLVSAGDEIDRLRKRNAILEKEIGNWPMEYEIPADISKDYTPQQEALRRTTEQQDEELKEGRWA